MTENLSRPILITGASTGIGNHLTHYLTERGHHVYATARKDSDLAELKKIEHVTPIRLDVRNPENIQTALTKIQAAGHGLYGLVNNAGIGGLGLFSTWTDEEMQTIFDINVFGVHRITNAFLPLLHAAKGRIVNIGSQGGMITSKYFGPYTMTKHALEAYTESLAAELAPYGVGVSVVQPGGIVSNIGANLMPDTIARFERAEEPFKEEAQQVLAGFNQPPPEPPENAEESADNRKPSSPEIVSEAVYHALFANTPKRCYLVGTQWEGDRVIDALIKKLLLENDNPQHNYSREELIQRLDKHLADRSAN